MDDSKRNKPLFEQLQDFSSKVPAPSFDSLVNASGDSFQGVYSEVLSKTNVMVPKYLWNEIELALQNKEKRRVIYYWYAVAGICLLILSGSFWFAFQNTLTDNISAHKVAFKGTPTKNDQISSPKNENVELIVDAKFDSGVDSARLNNSNKMKLKTVISFLEPSNIQNNSALGNLLIANNTKSNLEFIPLQTSSITVDSAVLKIKYWDVFDEEDLPTPKEPNNYLLANIGGFNKSQVSNGYESLASSDNAVNFASEASGFDIFTKKAPITTGIDFRFSINSKFSLNTGIQVTFQNNVYGNVDNPSSKQSNVFIGAPFELLYNVKSWRKTKIWGHAGHLQELLINSTNIYNGTKNKAYPFSPQLGFSSGISIDQSLYKEFGVSGYFGAVSYYKKPSSSYYTDRLIYPNFKISFRYNF